jgi:hypothetical protein
VCFVEAQQFEVFILYFPKANEACSNHPLMCLHQRVCGLSIYIKKQSTYRNKRKNIKSFILNTLTMEYIDNALRTIKEILVIKKWSFTVDTSPGRNTGTNVYMQRGCTLNEITFLGL